MIRAAFDFAQATGTLVTKFERNRRPQLCHSECGEESALCSRCWPVPWAKTRLPNRNVVYSSNMQTPSSKNSSSRLTILSVCGTRPDTVKMAPVVIELSKHGDEVNQVL